MLAVNIQKNIDDLYTRIRKYYEILFLINDYHITNQELSVLSYATIYGEVSSINYRRKIVEDLGISRNSLNNTVCSLVKKKLLYKDKETMKNRINPDILVGDMDQDILLNIKMLASKVKSDGEEA